MRKLTNVTSLLLIILLPVWVEAVHAAQQQSGEQSTSPQQQQQHAQASSSATAQSETGCLVRSDSGYALKTDTETLPIETDKDLSPYVNKRIKVTGILEHHSAAAPSSTSGPVVMTDLRLRVVVSVIGECNQTSK
jgi:cytoskeletal protein RodZ